MSDLLSYYASEEGCHAIAVDESSNFFRIWGYCILWGIAVAVVFHLPLHVFEAQTDTEITTLKPRPSKKSKRGSIEGRDSGKVGEERKVDERRFLSEALHGVASPEDGKESKSIPAKQQTLPEVTVTFQPGPLGFVRKVGHVASVDPGGQAEREGVQPGWTITAVNGQKCESFDAKVFENAKKGDRPYQVTFATASAEAQLVHYFKRMSRTSGSRPSREDIAKPMNICIRFLGVVSIEFDSPSQPKCDNPITWPGDAEIEGDNTSRRLDDKLAAVAGLGAIAGLSAVALSTVGAETNGDQTYSPPTDLGVAALKDELPSPDDVIAPQHCKLHMEDSDVHVPGDDVCLAEVKDVPTVQRSSISSGIGNPDPNLAEAEKHLLQTSNTIFENGAFKWRSVHHTSLDEIQEIGGEGIEQYFRLVRGLGICFAYMAICTSPLAAFSWNGNFLPDVGSTVGKSTIGNIGHVASANFPQQERYIILGCQGMPVKNFTTIFSCLDAIAILMLMIYICYFSLTSFTSVGSLDDLNISEMTDFAVKITGIPRTIDDQTAYEDRLKEHLLKLLEDLRGKYDVDIQLPPVKICEISLVRDYSKRLSSIKKRGEIKHEVEICRYKGDVKRVEKLEAQAEQLNKSLMAKLQPETQLPVLCAYVVLNSQSDVENLLFSFRFARLRILRICQGHKKRFEGRAICFTRAPDPSNIIFENHDISTCERLLRVAINLVLWLILVSASATAIFLINRMASTSNSQVAASQLDNSCDAGTHVPSDAYLCIYHVAVQWTNEQAASFGSDELGCFCQTKGHAAVLTSPALRTGLCKDWLLEVSKGYAVRVAAGLVIVIVNVVFRGIISVMVVFERAVSVSSFNTSYMWKTFVSQFINTAVVICLINWRAFGILKGDYDDFERGWFAIVGGAMVTTLILNAFLCCLINMGSVFLFRMWRCCRKRKMKHQAEIIELFTNPEFDISSAYAQLLTTVFCTLVYSAGMPVVLYLASTYCLLTYWCDKWVLLKASKRPAKVDASLPKMVVRILILSVPIHCAIAILMYSNECIFPADNLQGGLVDSAGSGGLQERLTKESTFLLTFMFILSIIVIATWFICLLFGGTTTGAALICSYCHYHCTRRHRLEHGHEAPITSFRKAETATFDKAQATIEKIAPPASYKLDHHPDFARFARYLRGDQGWESQVTKQLVG